MAQISGWVAGWTDGSETNILSIWTSQDEAKAACQQDVRNGEDMGLSPEAAERLDDDRYVLAWDTEYGPDPEHVQVVADTDNGQGTYFVEYV